MTVVTPGCCQSQAIAAWAGVRPGAWASTRAEKSEAAARPVSHGTPEKVSPTSKALPSRL
jgi:hypothetical protein